jgi:hypothetical protein
MVTGTVNVPSVATVPVAIADHVRSGFCTSTSTGALGNAGATVPAMLPGVGPASWTSGATRTRTKPTAAVEVASR